MEYDKQIILLKRFLFLGTLNVLAVLYCKMVLWKVIFWIAYIKVTVVDKIWLGDPSYENWFSPV